MTDLQAQDDAWSKQYDSEQAAAKSQKKPEPPKGVQVFMADARFPVAIRVLMEAATTLKDGTRATHMAISAGASTTDDLLPEVITHG